MSRGKQESAWLALPEAGEVNMEVTAPKHKRSKSDLARKRINEDKNNIFKAPHHLKLDMGQLKSCVEAKKRQRQSTEVHNSLKEEVLKLQKQLKDQFVIRSELEKAASSRPLLHDRVGEKSISKPAQDLIKEISVLELEVVYLEKYLLSLYRKTFHETQSSLSAGDENSKSNSSSNEFISSEVPKHDFASKKHSVIISNSSLTARDSTDNPPLDYCIHRTHSSLSQYSASSFRTSPPTRTVADQGVDLYHSLPLSMLERCKDDFSSVSLAEHLGSSDHVRLTANRLSEEMIKCISEIYCRLADPPLFNHGFPSSPISFSSPLSGSSPQDQYGVWNVHCEGKSSFNSWFNNPLNFQSEVSKEFSGSYCRLVEVQGICRNNHKLSAVEHMQRNFRSLVSQLEEVDPRKLKHGEKLAFWINVHNALVMHVFLVYGIPRGTLKRISLVLKAAYNIGGHIISVENIQSTILQCRLPRPGQWFQSFLFPKPKLKAGDARKAYGIEHPQPLLQFALCSGNLSDPMVRIYTPKSVFQELEVAKEEYIHNRIKVHKEHKILLPKIVDYYAKDSSLCPDGLMSMIEHSMPDCVRKSFQLTRKGKPSKKIEWILHNFTFRYLLSPDLAK